jgi:hypothetical protein
MEAELILSRLRRCGIVAHRAAKMPSPADGPPSIVVFLDNRQAQFEIARRCALQIPGVDQVTFAGFSRTVMYVYGAPPKRP